MKAEVRRADHLIGYLKKKMQALNLWDSTNIIILSDHGMAELSADKTIEPDQIIDMANVKRKIFGPVTMLQPKKDKGNRMYRALKNNENHYRVYKKRGHTGAIPFQEESMGG